MLRCLLILIVLICVQSSKNCEMNPISNNNNHLTIQSKPQLLTNLYTNNASDLPLILISNAQLNQLQTFNNSQNTNFTLSFIFNLIDTIRLEWNQIITLDNSQSLSCNNFVECNQCMPPDFQWFKCPNLDFDQNECQSLNSTISMSSSTNDLYVMFKTIKTATLIQFIDGYFIGQNQLSIQPIEQSPECDNTQSYCNLKSLQFEIPYRTDPSYVVLNMKINYGVNINGDLNPAFVSIFFQIEQSTNGLSLASIILGIGIALIVFTLCTCCLCSLFQEKVEYINSENLSPENKTKIEKQFEDDFVEFSKLYEQNSS